MMSPSKEKLDDLFPSVYPDLQENTFRLNLTEPKLLLMCLKETLGNCLTWLCEAIPCSFFPENSRFRNIRICVHAKPLPSCLTLCDPMDCSPPGSPVHRILQARMLEWVDIPSSRGSSQRRDQTSVSYVSCIGRSVLYR